MPQPHVSHHRTAGILLAIALLAVSSCRTGSAAQQSTGLVAIGVGAIPGRPGYEDVIHGMEMAIERLNEANGSRFRLRPPDRGSTSAVQIAQQMRDDSTVIGVVGHPESGNAIETAPIYADAENAARHAIVSISPTASSPRLSGISPWFFRLAPSDEVSARSVARWVLDSLDARRVAIIFRNDSYGRDWSGTFSETFLKAGGSVVARQPYLTGITEWDAYAQLLARLKPEVLLFPGDAGDAVQLLRALRAANVTLTFVGGDGTEGMRDSSDATGARYVSSFHPDRITTEEGRTFARRFQAKYGRQPNAFAAMSYDAALAIGRSVMKGARSRLALRRALERLGTPDSPAIEGAGGPIAFGKDHDVAGRVVVITTVGSVRGAN